jgi:hypothetical protein
MSDGKAREFALAFIRSILLDEARDYLQRGRRFRSVETSKLSEMWIIAFKSFASGSGDTRDVDDTGAELRLRGCAPPVEAVADDMIMLEASIKRTSVPDLMPALADKLDDFLVDYAQPN